MSPITLIPADEVADDDTSILRAPNNMTTSANSPRFSLISADDPDLRKQNLATADPRYVTRNRSGIRPVEASTTPEKRFSLVSADDPELDSYKLVSAAPDYIPLSQRKAGEGAFRPIKPEFEPPEGKPKGKMGFTETRQASIEAATGLKESNTGIVGKTFARYEPFGLSRRTVAQAKHLGNQETGFQNIRELDDGDLKSAFHHISGDTEDEVYRAFTKERTPETRQALERRLYEVAQERAAISIRAGQERNERGSTVLGMAGNTADEMIGYAGGIALGKRTLGVGFVLPETLTRYYELRSDDATIDSNGNMVLRQEAAPWYEAAPKAITGAVLAFTIETFLGDLVGGGLGKLGRGAARKLGFVGAGEAAENLVKQGAARVMPSQIRKAMSKLKVPDNAVALGNATKKFTRAVGVHDVATEALVEESSQQILEGLLNLNNDYESVSWSNLKPALQGWVDSLPEVVLGTALFRGGSYAASPLFKAAQDARLRRDLHDRLQRADIPEQVWEFGQAAPDLALGMMLAKGSDTPYSPAVFLAQNVRRHRPIIRGLQAFGMPRDQVIGMKPDERADTLYTLFDQAVSDDAAKAVFGAIAEPDPSKEFAAVDLLDGTVHPAAPATDEEPIGEFEYSYRDDAVDEGELPDIDVMSMGDMRAELGIDAGDKQYRGKGAKKRLQEAVRTARGKITPGIVPTNAPQTAHIVANVLTSGGQDTSSNQLQGGGFDEEMQGQVQGPEAVTPNTTPEEPAQALSMRTPEVAPAAPQSVNAPSYEATAQPSAAGVTGEDSTRLDPMSMSANEAAGLTGPELRNWEYQASATPEGMALAAEARAKRTDRDRLTPTGARSMRGRLEEGIRETPETAEDIKKASPQVTLEQAEAKAAENRKLNDRRRAAMARIDAALGAVTTKPGTEKPTGKAIGGSELKVGGVGWRPFPQMFKPLNVSRKDMPQVKAEHRGALTQFLGARDVEHESVEVAPDELKATQAEYSPAKVRAAQKFNDGDRAILVSSDNYVIDGHHQWAAAIKDGKSRLRVIRFNKPIAKILPMVKEFPSAGVETQSVSSKAPEVAQVESEKPVTDDTKAAKVGVKAKPRSKKAIREELKSARKRARKLAKAQGSKASEAHQAVVQRIADLQAELVEAIGRSRGRKRPSAATPLQEFRNTIRDAGLKPPTDLTADDFGAPEARNFGFPPGVIRKDGMYTWDEAIQEAAEMGLLRTDADPSELRRLFLGRAREATDKEIEKSYQEYDSRQPQKTAEERAKQEIASLKLSDPQLLTEDELATGDLVYRNGEWYRADEEPWGGTELLDGERISLDDGQGFEGVEIVKTSSDLYPYALEEYQQQEADRVKVNEAKAAANKPDAKSEQKAAKTSAPKPGSRTADAKPRQDKELQEVVPEPATTLSQDAQDAIRLYGSKSKAAEKVRAQRDVLKRTERPTEEVDALLDELEGQEQTALFDDSKADRGPKPEKGGQPDMFSVARMDAAYRGDLRTAPSGQLTQEDILRALPGATVREVDGEFEITAKNGSTLLLRVVDMIYPTPSYLNKIRKTNHELKDKSDAELREMGIAGYFKAVELEDGQGNRIDAADLILIANEAGQLPTDTLRHELLHWARALGLFTDAEWSALAGKYAGDIPVPGDTATKEEIAEYHKQQEERIAKALQTRPGILRRIQMLFRRLFARLRGNGAIVAGINAELEFRNGRLFARKPGMKGIGAAFSVGDRLRDTKDFPVDDVKPRSLDITGVPAKVIERAGREFMSWPETISAADGTAVLLHNTEEGSLAKRVKHLIWDNSKKSLDLSKAKWLPNVPNTLQNAAAVLRDPESGNDIYVREYNDNTKHMVVVSKDGQVVDQGIPGGRLITQFPYGTKGPGKQGNFRIQWERNGIGRTPENPNPATPASTIPGSRQAPFQENDTTESGDPQGPMFSVGNRLRDVDADFPLDDNELQWNMRVERERNATGRTPENPSATPSASMIPDSQRTGFQKDDTTEGPDAQGPMFSVVYGPAMTAKQQEQADSSKAWAWKVFGKAKELAAAIRAAFSDTDGRPELGLISQIAGTPLWNAEKVPQLKELWGIIDRMRDNAVDLVEFVTGGLGPDGELSHLRAIAMVTPSDVKAPNAAWSRIRKEYKALNQYLFERDRNGEGYLVKDEDGKYVVLSMPDENGKRRELARFSNEQEAWDNAWVRESHDYKAAGHSKRAARALLAVRRMNGNVYNIFANDVMVAEELRRQNGEPEGTTSIYNDDGSREILTLREALKRMGDRRGHYMPRIRKDGRYHLFAEKEGENPRRQHYDTKIGRAVGKAVLHARGYETENRLTNKPSEKVFGELDIANLNEVFETAIDRVRESTNDEASFESLGMRAQVVKYKRKDGKSERHLVIVAPKTPANDRIMMEFGGHRYGKESDSTRAELGLTENDPGVWHFERPNRGLQGDILSRFSHHSVNSAFVSLYTQGVAQGLADVLHSRGSRSRKIGRNDAKGKAVYLGYDEDAYRAVVSTAAAAASGSARAIMRRDAMNVVMGTTESLEQYFQRNKPDGFDEMDREEKADERLQLYREYRRQVRERRLSSAKQPLAYEEAMSLLHEVLRNEEELERIMGVLRGLTSYKMLSSPSSAAYNLSALALVVPPGIATLTDTNIVAAGMLTAKAANAYTAYWTLGTATEEDREILDEIRRRRWDNDDYAQEMTRNVNALGRGYTMATNTIMFPFSKAEQLNRGATIMATYKILRKKGLEKDEAFREARNISDKIHSRFGKENLPYLMRGGGVAPQVLRNAYLFQGFMLNHIQLLGHTLKKRDWPSLLWLSVAPIMVAGLEGGVVAGAASMILKPIIRAAFRAFGGEPPDEPYYALYEWIANKFGVRAERVVRTGALGLLNIDARGTLGFTPAISGNVFELAGAPMAAVGDVSSGLKKAAGGDIAMAAELAGPRATSNLFKAYREYMYGVTKGNGSPVFFGKEQIQPSLYATLLRSAGFNPAEISEKREILWDEGTIQRLYSNQDGTGIKDRIRDRVKRYSLKRDNPPESWEDIQEDIRTVNAQINAQQYRKGLVPFITGDTVRRWINNMEEAPRSEKTRDQDVPQKMPDFNFRPAWAK